MRRKEGVSMSRFYLSQEKYLELQKLIERNLSLYFEDTSFLAEELNINNKNGANLGVRSETNRSIDDLENAIKLHNYYKDLPYSLASDGNFWTLLTHTEYWDYMRARWPVEEAQNDQIKYIGRRYFFKEKGRARNGLARLWWFAELSYDSELEDPYHYTRLMLQDQDLAAQIIENTYLSRNKFALKALFNVLEYITTQEKSGHIYKLSGTEKREIVRDLAQYFNLLGAVELWDILSIDEVENKLLKWIEQYIATSNMIV